MHSSHCSWRPGETFIRGGLIGAGEEAQEQVSILETFVEVAGAVYRQTFIRGWGDALASLGANQWWLPTVVALAAVGAVAWFHIREDKDERPPTARPAFAALACGLLLVIAAIGLLMWVPFYREDSWRIYMFVPVGAAIAVCSLITADRLADTG